MRDKAKVAANQRRYRAAHREEVAAFMADRMRVLGETMRISKLPPELRELALSIRAVRQAIQRRNAA